MISFLLSGVSKIQHNFIIPVYDPEQSVHRVEAKGGRVVNCRLNTGQISRERFSFDCLQQIGGRIVTDQTE